MSDTENPLSKRLGKPISGGALITEPLVYRGEIDPKYLEKITITVGELMEFWEEACRSGWNSARRNHCYRGCQRSAWSSPDHWFNSSEAHELQDAAIAKVLELSK